MRKFQCVLFVLKRSCICYYMICMTVSLKSFVQGKYSMFLHEKKLRVKAQTFLLNLDICIQIPVYRITVFSYDGGINFCCALLKIPLVEDLLTLKELHKTIFVKFFFLLKLTFFYFI